ncbi:MAG: DUF4012 domain-containing protein, partial [Anaerolineae bacterium]|nr:DUF4012 domain-containing protein [Anaerolineae bacterium]
MQINSKFYRRLGIALMVIGMFGVIFWGFRMLSTVNRLRSDLDRAKSLMDIDNPLSIKPDEISSIVMSSLENIIRLRRDISLFARMGSYLAWVPKYGPLLSEASDLLRLADVATETMVDLWVIAQPVYVDAQEQGIQIDLLLGLLDAITADLGDLHTQALHLYSAYQAVKLDAIPWRYRALFEQVGPLLKIYAHGLPVVDDVADLIGLEQPDTYLVLALNEDELRPGGGFISGVGELKLRNGRISSMEFHDSYQADDYSLPYPDAPAPLQQFMAIELWVFRDSNWSPDFPTTAQQAIALYRPSEPVTPSGVIALDQYAASHIVDVVGPLHIPDSDSLVTGETLVEYIRNAWAPNSEEFNMGWWLEHKSFMGDITRATLDRVESGAVDWTRLFQTAVSLVEQRHIQLYIDNADVAQFLDHLDWSSQLAFPGQDSFLFAEANLGYNKVSMNIQHQLRYDVDLSQTPPVASASLTLQHLSENDTDCIPEVKYYPDYLQSMERCYWTYLRFFVPEGAQLLEASEH